MVTRNENVNINIRERGTRTVTRRLDGLIGKAEGATRAFRLMQNAIFVLGLAGVAANVVRFGDVLTSTENRIRLVTNGLQELNNVQQELFALSRRSRADFEVSAQIYARTALSVKNLGIEQSRVLRFTESLNEAVVLSGATAREANAALIQLAQGLASNRLSGDELRSVLEQLPFVADIIARSLGKTRGELRAFAKEGGITTIVVLDAFQRFGGEISQLFGETIPTVGQALNVLKTSFLSFLKTTNDTTSATAALAKGILLLSDNLNLLAGTVLTLGGIFVANRISKGLLALFAGSQVVSSGIVTALPFLRQYGSTIGDVARNLTLAAIALPKFSRAQRRGINVAGLELISGTLEGTSRAAPFAARNLRNRAGATRSAARGISNVANPQPVLDQVTRNFSVAEGLAYRQLGSAQIGARNARAANAAALVRARALEQNRSLLLLEQQRLQITKSSGRARSVLTGAFVNESKALQAQAAIKEKLLRLDTRVAAAQLASAAAEGANVAAIKRLNNAKKAQIAATASASTILGRLTRRFPVLSAAIGKIGPALAIIGSKFKGIGLLFARIGAAIIGVFGAVPTAIGVAVGGLFLFRNQILITNDRITTLADGFRALTEIIERDTRAIRGYLADAFSGIGAFIVEQLEPARILLASILDSVANYSDGIADARKQTLDSVTTAETEVQRVARINAEFRTAQQLFDVGRIATPPIIERDEFGDYLEQLREELRIKRLTKIEQLIITSQAKAAKEVGRPLTSTATEGFVDRAITSEEDRVALEVINGDFARRNTLLKDYIELQGRETAAIGESNGAKGIRLALEKATQEFGREQAGTTEKVLEISKRRQVIEAELDRQRQVNQTSVNTLISSLQQENKLIGLSNGERKVQTLLLNAQSEALGKLTDEQLRNIEAQGRGNNVQSLGEFVANLQREAARSQLNQRDSFIQGYVDNARDIYGAIGPVLEDQIRADAAIVFANQQRSGSKKTFEDYIRLLMNENKELQVNSREREILNEIHKIETGLKRPLIEDEKELVRTLKEENAVLQVYRGLLDSIQEPQLSYADNIAALNKLHNQGIITSRQFTDSIREQRIQLLENSNTFGDGFELGYQRIFTTLKDSNETIASAITTTYQGALDSLAEFALTGENTFSNVIKNMNAELIKLAANEAFQFIFKSVGSVFNGDGSFNGGSVANYGNTQPNAGNAGVTFGQVLGGAFGGAHTGVIGGGNAGNGAGTGFGNFFTNLFSGANNGASFTVGQGSGMSIPGIDNRLVPLRLQDGEEVNITPRGGNRGGGDTFIFNIKSETPEQFGSQRTQDQLGRVVAGTIQKARRNS